MEEITFNYLGKSLDGIKIVLLDPSFGTVDDNNVPHINWGDETEKCDKNGFDKEHRPIPESELYVIKDFILPKGMIVCRYGYSGGSFTTIKGSCYEALGLPYVKETIEYHEYKVTEDVSVNCYVTKGIVAPKFFSEGGAIQFMHKQPIRLECEDGYLKEDYSWRLKKY